MPREAEQPTNEPSSSADSEVPGPGKWPAEQFKDDARRIGSACSQLIISESKWINRKVETVDILTHEAVKRAMSVDFTVPSFLQESLKTRSGQFLVPIAMLRKEPLRNFNLRDEAGQALPILARRDHQWLAKSILHSAIQRITAHPISEELDKVMMAIAKSTSSIETENAIADLEQLFDQGDPCTKAVVADHDVIGLLGSFATNYVLGALVDDIRRRRILKISYEDVLSRDSGFGVLQRLGWKPQLFRLDTPAAGRTASYHIDLVVPEELRIELAVLVEDVDEGGRVYAVAENADRATLYSSAVEPGTPTYVLFGNRVERSGFPSNALIAATITSCLLTIGAIGPSPGVTQPDAAVSLLAAGSALYSGSVARSGEHRLVNWTLGAPRMVLLVSTLAALAAAAASAFSFTPGTTDSAWKLGAIVSWIMVVMLAVLYLRAASGREDRSAQWMEGETDDS